ncbi:MAG: heme o synthase [bacterium]|nr:heme o synthase [bacterium]
MNSLFAGSVALKEEVTLFNRVSYSCGLYYELCKPRIVAMVCVITALGFILAGGNIFNSFALFAMTVLGTVLTGAGSSALNQYIERDSDKLMDRTARRPLPSGKLAADSALYFGLITILFGVAILVVGVNLLVGFLSLLTAFLYVLVYTPLKKITWINTTVGAIPGALPTVGGWVAVTGSIDLGAMVLFLILFLWQHPHFFAIAWMYKDDYEKGGHAMLPVVDKTGKATFRQMSWYTHHLILASILPVWFGLAGTSYLIGSILAGAYFLVSTLEFYKSANRVTARKVVVASLVYLPVLLGLVILEAWIS